MNVEQDLRARPREGDADIWRELETILAEWRAAERRLAATLPGSPEHARATGEVDRLRELYHRTYSFEYPESDQS